MVGLNATSPELLSSTVTFLELVSPIIISFSSTLNKKSYTPNQSNPVNTINIVAAH